MQRFMFATLAAATFLLCGTSEGQAFGARGRCGHHAGCHGSVSCGGSACGGCASSPAVASYGMGGMAYGIPNISYGMIGSNDISGSSISGMGGMISGSNMIYYGMLRPGQWILDSQYGWVQIVSVGPIQPATQAKEPRIERMPEPKKKPKAPNDQ